MLIAKFIRKVWHDPFFKKSGLFFFGSMMIAGFNYLYHPVLARLLPLHEFGDVEALLSLLGVTSTLLGGFTLAAVHASVNAASSEECAALIAALRRAAIGAVGIFFVILTLGSKYFAQALHFSDPLLFTILAISLALAPLSAMRNGYLQGKGNFFSMSVGGIITSAGRLIFAVAFVAIGWRAFGAVLGLLIAQLISFGYLFLKTRKALTVAKAEMLPLTAVRFRQEIGYVGLVAAVTAFVSFLYMTDILVVKKFFTPEIAGAYSGISTVANIAFFATAPIAAVLLSSVKRNDPVEHQRNAFIKAIGTIGIIGTGVVGAFLIFPELITKLLIGTRYLPFAHLLPWLGGAFFCAALTNVCIYLGLALRKKALLILSMAGTFLLLVLTMFRHGTVQEIAQNYLIADACAALVAGGLAWQFLKGKTPAHETSLSGNPSP